MDNVLQQYKNLVAIRFQLYNSLFTSLPFHRIEKTGVLLSLFLIHCEEGYRKQQSPNDIITSFMEQYTPYRKEQELLDLLFRFIQYAERQVVLFDALEDAAFCNTHDMNGPGSLKHLQSEVIQKGKQGALAEKMKRFSIRMVLTAHPTQFYPGEVLGIISDLAKALSNADSATVNEYLQQLGKTPFLKREKPKPYDEAVSLLWYLENIFYPASGKILSEIKSQFPDAVDANNPLIHLGFWPGGDRDGNPFVTSDTTVKVAESLRRSIMKCYYLELRKLRRRLTFKGISDALLNLENQLYTNLFVKEYPCDVCGNQLLKTLLEIRETLITQHNGLFLYKLENLISKVQVFGLHFASLDVRQDSGVHGKLIEDILAHTKLLPANYQQLDEDGKIAALMNVKELEDIAVLDDELSRDCVETVRAIKGIQQVNGEKGCHRYIISHTTSAVNIMEVYGLFMLSGWDKKALTIDIVPLFETVEDLQNAGAAMQKLYAIKEYRAHLEARGNTQTIMLGFSDGTKDGGYLMANWSIYKAKEELTRISREYDIDVVFFDGRGGPPARGGGKTHKFYASMGQNIANNEIQLTIQGQTISSNFGTIDSAQFNIEQLINAGISNELFAPRRDTLSAEEDALLNQLAVDSFDSYVKLKNHPYFLEYLGHASPLRFYSQTNIGSRPAKRGSSNQLSLNDLRAIPYVGSWSQLKQNVTGYYGVGQALKKMDEAGRWNEVSSLYKSSLLFKTLMDNCEMSMKKTFFPLTAFLSEHPKYGEIWNLIYAEYELTKKYVLRLSGNADLMGDYPVDQLSIQMRERIVLPLLTIQQFGITKVRELEEQLIDSPVKSNYEKMVMRCSFGIINAGRNSV
ncbi:Phosphoenolpyruvate carboxylase, type 1 [Filimonas lacunae]|uniref:Phosphoenolpyruvate carboxylase n=1 Tax=Filimonas lacunae TaxID=477680 RepID=A0A173MAP0_9BACT|nr:phosphoenolpyruvate carboxylase [Filimonas lacunae]BAV04624.1 phosphoenolpyruvate carboxylase [Filimonas lacunae]SIT32605.1 Phosphoenolpyruvate carboxylase, type 1 [Filimonas lacunae]